MTIARYGMLYAVVLEKREGSGSRPTISTVQELSVLTIHEDEAWLYACEKCRGEGQIAVPTFRGSPTTAMRTCRRCNGTCIDPTYDNIAIGFSQERTAA